MGKKTPRRDYFWCGKCFLTVSGVRITDPKCPEHGNDEGLSR